MDYIEYECFSCGHIGLFKISKNKECPEVTLCHCCKKGAFVRRDVVDKYTVFEHVKKPWWKFWDDSIHIKKNRVRDDNSYCIDNDSLKKITSKKKNFTLNDVAKNLSRIRI